MLFRSNKPTFVISKPYAALLDGVGYCDRIEWGGDYSRPMEALKYVESLNRFDMIYVAQCYGTSHSFQCSSFAEEAWRLVGRREFWGKLPLVFDRRSQEREDDLLRRVGNREGKSMVLVSKEGLSSPFKSMASLIGILEPLSTRYDFIDLNGFKAERFYDLLALYERAFALIAIDTGTLHLAQATPNLPVIALVTDSPTLWHGAPVRPNHALRIRYKEFESRKGEIVNLLMNPIASSQPRIFHVWNDYARKDPSAIRRHEIAKKSWQMEYTRGPWRPMPILDTELGRDGRVVGETKALPFVNDLIDKAAEAAGPNDIICLTNDDTVFVQGITDIILKNSPCWAGRWEHNHVHLPMTPEKMRVSAYKHCGADVFAFTKQWWMENKASYPLFILAREAWDLALRTLINLRGGREVEACCCHIIHNPEWHSAKYRECKGNLFNRDAARGFFAANNMPWPKV